MQNATSKFLATVLLCLPLSSTVLAGPLVEINCESKGWFSSTKIIGEANTAGKTLSSTIAKHSGNVPGIGVRKSENVYTTGNRATVWAGRLANHGAMKEASAQGFARIKVLSESVNYTTHCSSSIAVYRSYDAKMEISYFNRSGEAMGSEVSEFTCVAPFEMKLDDSNCPG